MGQESFREGGFIRQELGKGAVTPKEPEGLRVGDGSGEGGSR